MLATASSGQRGYVPYDHDTDYAGNHEAAAHSLANKYHWYGRWVGGEVRDGYVFVVDAAAPSFRVVWPLPKPPVGTP
jgi:hypothetical protein